MNKSKVSKNKESEFDLGKNKVNKLFWSIFIPTVISMIIGGTFLVFDTFFLAHGYQPGHIGQPLSWVPSGTSAYATLGPNGTAYALPYTLIIISVGLMIGAGISTKMTKAKAVGDENAVKDALSSFGPTVIIYGLVITIIFLIFAKFFVWMGTGFQTNYLEAWFYNPLIAQSYSGVNTTGQYVSTVNKAAIGQLFSQSAWYIRIQALAAIPYIYMIASALVLRVEGKARFATYFSGAALVVNILLDVLLINVSGLNIVGAGLATSTAQIIAATCYYIYFHKYFPIRVKKANWSEAYADKYLMFKLGYSSMSLQLISAAILLSMTIAIGLTNYGDPSIISAYTTSFQGFFSLYSLFILIVIAISQSMMPIVLYNAGTGDNERTASAKKIGFTLMFVFSLSVTALMILLPNITTELFPAGTSGGVVYSIGSNGVPVINWTASGSGIFGYEQRITQILFVTFIITSWILLAGIYMQSIGETKIAAFLLFTKIIAIFPLALILGFTVTHVTPYASILPWVDTPKSLLMASPAPANASAGPIQKTGTPNWFLQNGNQWYEFAPNGLSLSMFWAIPIVDIIIFSIGFPIFLKVEKRVKKNGYQKLQVHDEKSKTKSIISITTTVGEFNLGDISFDYWNKLNFDQKFEIIENTRIEIKNRKEILRVDNKSKRRVKRNFNK